MTESKEKTRWGILGTAAIAHREVAPALRAASNCETIAIASRDEKRARRFAETHRIPRSYGSYEALLSDSEIEIVYIPLPNHLHAEWTIHAAEAGKHVLCEKPLAGTRAEAERMVNACRTNGVVLMEAFMYRFHPQTMRVQALLAAGTIGPLRLFRGAHSFALHRLDRDDDFRWGNETAGGSLLDLGTYCVDTARLMFDSEPVCAYATRQLHPGHNADASMQGILEFPDDRVAVFDCSFVQTLRKEYELVGEAGAIRALDPYNPGKGNDVSIHILTGGCSTVETVEAQDEYRLEVEHLATCVRESIPPLIDPTHSLENLAAIDALRESAERKKLIWLDR